MIRCFEVSCDHWKTKWAGKIEAGVTRPELIEEFIGWAFGNVSAYTYSIGDGSVTEMLQDQEAQSYQLYVFRNGVAVANLWVFEIRGKV